MRDILLQNPAVDIIQAEEDWKKERTERWDRAVAVYKKKSDRAPGAKQSTTSYKGGTSVPPASSLQIREQSPTEQSRKESSEKVILMGETSLDERMKKQRTDDINSLVLSAMAAPDNRNKPRTGTVVTSELEIPTSGSSENDTIVGSTVVNPSTRNENLTLSSEQPRSESELETAATQKGPESQNPERERTQQSKGGSELGKQGSEKRSGEAGEQAIVATMTSYIPSTQLIVAEREGSKEGSLSRSNLLITSEVEEDNTIVSVGDYSFHTKSKVVMRRRTKKSEGAILWTPQGHKPEERVM